ncbi:putative RNA-binding protein [Spiroplasma sabaudiense Ar-1343]|uniref:Putative RNA-binding protein n=1 Tax=Spiroplasma sabaudiense Ar-1343 TaxID=1276257 RepID=W6AA84_9MOLU|nr:YlxR family protein [Spiroplasma sabaudiense]AHI53977.1 putative RNA-binding protein [Spiroplasma sabaudiense Ar-1343]
MEKSKHIVTRKDVASNQMLPKQELIRIVKNKNNEVFIDQSKKANGRGIYIAPNLKSLEKVMKTNIIEKVLKIKLDKEFYNILKKEIEENWD